MAPRMLERTGGSEEKGNSDGQLLPQDLATCPYTMDVPSAAPLPIPVTHVHELPMLLLLHQAVPSRKKQIDENKTGPQQQHVKKTPRMRRMIASIIIVILFCHLAINVPRLIQPCAPSIFKRVAAVEFND